MAFRAVSRNHPFSVGVERENSSIFARHVALDFSSVMPRKKRHLSHCASKALAKFLKVMYTQFKRREKPFNKAFLLSHSQTTRRTRFWSHASEEPLQWPVEPVWD